MPYALRTKLKGKQRQRYEVAWLLYPVLHGSVLCMLLMYQYDCRNGGVAHANVLPGSGQLLPYIHEEKKRLDHA